MSNNSTHTNTKRYILWRRVSTKEQGNSELGLKAQVAIAEYFMKSSPDKIYTDVYTGTKLNECKELWKAIEYCKENNLILVIAKTDRFRCVIDALRVLDEIGEGNLIFCDLPTTDRTVLTIVFALWERQAIQGRINTQVALNERKKQLEKDGKFMSKNGNIITKLGAPPKYYDAKGNPVYDMTAAVQAQARKKTEDAIMWKKTSKAYLRALRKKAEGWTLKQTVEDLKELYAENPESYGTRKGACPSAGVVSRWWSEESILSIPAKD